MVEERVERSQSELQERGGKFLGDLFQRIYEWAVGQGMTVVTEFKNEEIEIWDCSGGRRPLTMPHYGLSLEKGVIFDRGKDGLIFAITLGKGHDGGYERDIPTRLQFGVVHSPPEKPETSRQLTTLENLAEIVNQQPVRPGWMSGEFRWGPRGMSIACRYDAEIYGGEKIGLYPGWPVERILSEEGLVAYVKIVERTVGQGKSSGR